MILKPAPVAAFSLSSRLLLAQPAASTASARTVRNLNAVCLMDLVLWFWFCCREKGSSKIWSRGKLRSSPKWSCFTRREYYPVRTAAASSVEINSPGRSGLHQVVVDELIRLGPDAQIATERLVEGEDHENDEPYEGGQERHQDAMQPRVLHLEKEGGAQADDCAHEDDRPHHAWQSRAHRIESHAAGLDHVVVGAQGLRVQDSLAVGGWLETDQCGLEFVH